VVALDLVGTGSRVDESVPLTIAAMADDVRRCWLKRRDEASQWGVLGLSMGGMVAMSWASRHPHDVDALIVGNSSASGVGRTYQRLSWRSWAPLARTIVTRDVARRERLVLDLVCENYTEAERDVLAGHYADLARESPFGPRAFISQLIASASFQAPARLPMPVRVLRGAGDRFVSPKCSARLARRFEVPLYTHATAGHDLSLDAPDWLVGHVQAMSQSSAKV
jgi:pimeloyl-ACP methyl ester carboxylesterase